MDRDASVSSLNRIFIRALKRLGDAGDIDAACRMAAEAWSLLRHDWPEEARRLNGVLHNLTSPNRMGKKERPMNDNANLDVRQLIPAQRHRLIFETWHNLEPGKGFVLVNDHDPKPLYYQFDAEHSGEFTWDYLEAGPEVWRVRIGRKSAA
ncbi:MAG: DUF2249 domain-containing protein [Parvibaculum sp.]|uniref:DUF2249 domain-containing protein n=1 Tax=Parvibaculum sp. TaxID=2024848 RepID=UPI003C7873DC